MEITNCCRSRDCLILFAHRHIHPRDHDSGPSGQKSLLSEVARGAGPETEHER